MTEGHGKDQVDARLKEAVDASEISHFAFATAEQRADSAADSLEASTLVHAYTQVHRGPLQSLLTPVCSQSQNCLQTPSINIYSTAAAIEARFPLPKLTARVNGPS